MEKKFFALRASCPRLRFTGYSAKIFFCATRLVPAPKVYRIQWKKIFLRATRLVHARCFFASSAAFARIDVIREGKANVFLFALRASCPPPFNVASFAERHVCYFFFCFCCLFFYFSLRGAVTDSSYRVVISKQFALGALCLRPLLHPAKMLGLAKRRIFAFNCLAYMNVLRVFERFLLWSLDA